MEQYLVNNTSTFFIYCILHLFCFHLGDSSLCFAVHLWSGNRSQCAILKDVLIPKMLLGYRGETGFLEELWARTHHRSLLCKVFSAPVTHSRNIPTLAGAGLLSFNWVVFLLHSAVLTAFMNTWHHILPHCQWSVKQIYFIRWPRHCIRWRD